MRVAYIVRSFPRLSQTFILNEMLAVERLGVRLHLFAMTNPHEAIVQPEVAQLQAPIIYLDDLPETRFADPQRVARVQRFVEDHPELDEGYTTASRFACLEMAVGIAQMLSEQEQRGEPIDHIHAHFAHDPTLIAQLVQMLTGISYSFTAHARDLVQIPPAALISRTEHATAVATCSATNMDYFKATLPASLLAKVKLIYHGVDTERFQPAAKREANDVPQIVSIGRLVAKKGFGDLVAACGLLHEQGQAFHCTIYGEGPLEGDLTRQIADLGLQEVVSLPGACTQREIVSALQGADLFALTPFVTEDGDRDGVPNVLVEAMACGLPVVSTAVAGIPELVRDGENGVLVAAHDVAGIAAALATLLGDSTRRVQMSAAARQTVIDSFDLRAGARQMVALFEQLTSKSLG